MICAHVLQAARVKHREDPVLVNSLMQRGDQVRFRNRSLLEELLHQFVLAFRDELDESLVSRLRIGENPLWNLPYLTMSISIRLVEKRLHRHQIHHAMKSMLINDWQLHR